jgi:hypothetical protein
VFGLHGLLIRVRGSAFKGQGFRDQRSEFIAHGPGYRVGVQGSGFRVQGSGFSVHGLGFRVQGSGFRVQGVGFRVQGSGFRVQGSGFRVQGSYIRVEDAKVYMFMIGVSGASSLGTRVTVERSCNHASFNNNRSNVKDYPEFRVKCEKQSGIQGQM